MTKGSITTRLALFALVSWGVTAISQARRALPEDIKPVVHGSVCYCAPHEIGSGEAFVEARSRWTGRLLWKVKVFEIEFLPQVEKDAQEVFIAGLAVDRERGVLVITDERGRVYHLSFDTRKVRPAEESAG